MTNDEIYLELFREYAQKAGVLSRKGFSSPLSCVIRRMRPAATMPKVIKRLIFVAPCARPAEDGRLHSLETAVPAVIRAPYRDNIRDDEQWDVRHDKPSTR